MLLRTALAFVAGVVLSLAFEPIAIAYLIPFAVAAFALTTRGLRARSGWVPGLAFGVGFYFVHIYWMNPSVGVVAWVGTAAVSAAFYGLAGSASAVLQRLHTWPLLVPAAWTAIEAWRSGWPFSGMPWGRLSFGVLDTPAADAVAYVGSTGLSFLLATMGCLLAWVVVESGRTRMLAGAVLVAVCAISVLPALAPYSLEQSGQATVAAVQGDVPGRGNDILLDFRQVTDNHVQATVDLAGDVAAGRVAQPDFVLWPENSTSVDPFRDGSTNGGIRTAADAVGVPILVGAIVDSGPDNVLNQGIVWDPVTGAGDRYTKWHPVVFGEYIPFRRYLEGAINQLDRIPRDMLSGDRHQPIRVGDIEVADAICFDVAYDDGFYAQVRNGAEMLTVQTSNAIFIFTDQIEQQFAITRLRAIETGRWLVVASTNGISGVVAPDGSVVATADPRTRAVLVEEVALMSGITPAVWLGAWPARLFTVVTLLGLAVCLVPYRRRGDSTRPADREPDADSQPVERQPA